MRHPLTAAHSSNRLAWLEGLRILAAVMILLYHGQLLFIDYRYTPQPTGLLDNLQGLIPAQVAPAAFWGHLLAAPTLFGFQFVDVFVMISGFSLMLSLRQQSLSLLPFWRRRLLRILWPFWTVAWASYPVLWAIGVATQSYVPSLWHIFAGATFPLLFDYRGSLLLPTSGPWWFVPLIVSFTLVFPLLHWLQQRWGSRNLLFASLAVTLTYRILAIYSFGGHPTYAIFDNSNAEQPFQVFLAKLSTFVVGMVVARQYQRGQGALFWPQTRKLTVGAGLYGVGFISQFYKLGWVFCDLLLPLGLTLLCGTMMAAIATRPTARTVLIRAGRHSYSFFLIHNFVVDRTLNLVVQGIGSRYVSLLLPMIALTYGLAVVADRLQPLLIRILQHLWRDLDYLLSASAPRTQQDWTPIVGDRVVYTGRTDWEILQIEILLDDGNCYLCKITNQHQSLWVSQERLTPITAQVPDSFTEAALVVKNRKKPSNG
ncbi:acyltransferase [Romeria aff. gracilis LEGE 07310]|uniref:Acyltransferase n=1 Tax=Vasconcelosia minhoensis LEGE 07310 TaxID=915328 RepID=A0A8J7AUZ8_9CYAN|nr:acyltransferase [Romeria gracilis]MBE9079794.1 acyltransferase [Romeria aff. gracilis LEGE 07310]